ncbi:MAG: methylated-DNA--[protein]-cysteine S-methyltransferase [Bacteroidota bacterium]
MKKDVSILDAAMFELCSVNKDEITELNYSFQSTPFGEIIVASSEKGISWLAFTSSRMEGVTDLTMAFANVKLTENKTSIHKAARKVILGKTPKKALLNSDWKINLCVSGSDFQQQVWKELLSIPVGETTTYGTIAENLNLPIGASRAVGTAVGKNPIAFLIPCHRVIQLSGKLGGYRWGIERKREILTIESSSNQF